MLCDRGFYFLVIYISVFCFIDLQSPNICILIYCYWDFAVELLQSTFLLDLFVVWHQKCGKVMNNDRKELYSRAATLRQQFNIVTINWLNNHLFILFVWRLFWTLEQTFVGSPWKEQLNLMSNARVPRTTQGLFIPQRINWASGSLEAVWFCQKGVEKETGMDSGILKGFCGWIQAAAISGLWTGWTLQNALYTVKFLKFSIQYNCFRMTTPR